MAYSDLNQNQTVSFNNLQSGVSQGVFTAKTTIPSSNRQVTKAQANAYININTSLPSYVSKASNQLITKQDLSGIVTVTPYLMYGVAANYAYKSIDGGATWSVLSGSFGYDLDWTGIAGDSTGNYIALICLTQNNQVYISNNGGTSFNAVTLSYILIGFYPTGVSMSANGQYVCVAGCSTNITQSSNRNARIATSNNYGASFGAGSYTDGTGVNLYNASGKISVSGNGQYMTAVFAYNVDPNPQVNIARPWSFRVYSNNYGASWTKSGGSEFFGFLDIALDYFGQNQFLTSDYLKPGVFGSRGIKALVSNDFGSTWTEKYSNTTAYYFGGSQNSGFVSATISDDGRTMVGATNGQVYFQNLIIPALSPRVITSTNYGSTFSSTDGYTGNVGIAGGNITTTGVTNNYIGMMLFNTGQYNYSINGGTSFVPNNSSTIIWSQIYRKAYLYNPGGGGGGGQTVYTWYLSTPQTSGCNGYGYYPTVVYSNNPSFLSGATFYSDPGLTYEFDGFGYWYMDSTFENGCTIQIGPAGETFNISCC